MTEVRSLVERGYPEVMLLGQTVNAYRHGGLDFAGLLDRVHAVDGLRRLRFTTSHPEHVDARLADAFRDLPKVCPYLHLPVQSGSDRILAYMRRGYTRAGYLRQGRAAAGPRRPPSPCRATSSWAIPAETEADFQDTVELVDEVGFEGLFVFTYSPRPGTTASALPTTYPEKEKLRRLQVLNDQQQRRQERANARPWAARRGPRGHGRRRRAGSPAAPATSGSSTSTEGPSSSAALVEVDITASGPTPSRGAAPHCTIH